MEAQDAPLMSDSVRQILCTEVVERKPPGSSEVELHRPVTAMALVMSLVWYSVTDEVMGSMTQRKTLKMTEVTGVRRLAIQS